MSPASAADSLPSPGTVDELRGRCARAVLLLLVAGVICRAILYATRISYWHDEAFLILNLIDHGPRELMGYLEHAQAAPPVFLWIERGLYDLFGTDERGLRLLPLACGLASLALFAAVSWRLLASVPEQRFWLAMPIDRTGMTRDP